MTVGHLRGGACGHRSGLREADRGELLAAAEPRVPGGLGARSAPDIAQTPPGHGDDLQIKDPPAIQNRPRRQKHFLSESIPIGLENLTKHSGAGGIPSIPIDAIPQRGRRAHHHAAPPAAPKAPPGGGSMWGYVAKARKLRWAGCELDQA